MADRRRRKNRPRTRTGWRRTADKMPQVGLVYLVWRPGLGTCVAVWRADNSWRTLWEPRPAFGYPVTHYRPMPQGPIAPPDTESDASGSREGA